MQEILQDLYQLLGKENVLTDENSLEHYGKDWTKVHSPSPLVIVLPKTTKQVQALVKLANAKQFKIVPSGGRTGLSGGAVASNNEVVISLEKMNRIIDFNAIDRSVHCEAGVITGQLQQLALDNDLYYPVDFASSGSSQIGGNIATNAGGIKVVRYGLTRNWVSGLTVVTGKGDILKLNKGLVKNATGYDMRHLFIGSEGTLGIITEATMQLARKPKSLTVMVVGVNTVSSLMSTFSTFQNAIDLTAFECFSEQTLDIVHRDKGLARPFETQAPYYALLEFENDNEQTEQNILNAYEKCLQEGWALDGIMSQNDSQAKNLWRLREDISETLSAYTPYKNDLSVTTSAIPTFMQSVIELISNEYREFTVVWYGHIGDGNVHLNILKPAEMDQDTFFKKCEKLNPKIYSLTQSLKGSISAEHGVGTLKRDYLHYCRSEDEIEYMKTLKLAFDPNNVMNPGKVLPS